MYRYEHRPTVRELEQGWIDLLAFATNRVHGLGLTQEDFWSMTDRELAAHREVCAAPMAAILSAIHNGAMTRKDEQPFTPEMFMPGYVELAPKAGIAEDQRLSIWALLKARQRRPTPEDFEAQKQIAYRMNRAREAAASGATAEQINAIMRGVL